MFCTDGGTTCALVVSDSEHKPRLPNFALDKASILQIEVLHCDLRLHDLESDGHAG